MAGAGRRGTLRWACPTQRRPLDEEPGARPTLPGPAQEDGTEVARALETPEEISRRTPVNRNLLKIPTRLGCVRRTPRPLGRTPAAVTRPFPDRALSRCCADRTNSAPGDRKSVV